MTKNIYEVKFKVTDRGNSYEQKREVVATNQMYIPEELHAYYHKYRRSMDLSTKFQLEILGHQLIGWK